MKNAMYLARRSAKNDDIGESQSIELVSLSKINDLTYIFAHLVIFGELVSQFKFNRRGDSGKRGGRGEGGSFILNT